MKDADYIRRENEAAQAMPSEKAPIPASKTQAKRIAAQQGVAYSGPEDYARKNPLGGVARMFDAMADRTRAGENFYEVLRDYGLRQEDQWASAAAESKDAGRDAGEGHNTADTNPPRAQTEARPTPRTDVTKALEARQDASDCVEALMEEFPLSGKVILGALSLLDKTVVTLERELAALQARLDARKKEFEDISVRTSLLTTAEVCVMYQDAAEEMRKAILRAESAERALAEAQTCYKVLFLSEQNYKRSLKSAQIQLAEARAKERERCASVAAANGEMGIYREILTLTNEAKP